jgi:hypothetical protein
MQNIPDLESLCVFNCFHHMSSSASVAAPLTNAGATGLTLTPPQCSPPLQDVSDGGSERGMSPPCSGSPPQDSDTEPEEPVDDDSDNNWEDIPAKATPPSREQVAQKQIPRLGDSDDDGDLPDVAGISTWLECNPGKHAIPPCDRPKRVIGPEQRRTLYDRAKSKKNQKAALYAEIAVLNKKRNKKLPVLAEKHGFKLKLVQQQMAAATTFKQECKVSMYRAKLHYLSKLLNKGWHLCFTVDSCPDSNIQDFCRGNDSTYTNSVNASPAIWILKTCRRSSGRSSEPICLHIVRSGSRVLA